MFLLIASHLPFVHLSCVVLKLGCCDQVNQVVPLHQKNGINRIHQLDPVHQVDHTYDLWGGIGAAFCVQFDYRLII